jgi:hypothetical protein
MTPLSTGTRRRSEAGIEARSMPASFIQGRQTIVPLMPFGKKPPEQRPPA